MADTRHIAPAAPPTEGDGVNYRGLVWFVVILIVTTLACQVLMWGLFALFDRQSRRDEIARRPLAAEPGQLPPGPNLLTDEPAGLRLFRQREEAILHGYGWVDEPSGTARIPIERAKQLLLDRGLPVRGATPSGAKEPGSQGAKEPGSQRAKEPGSSARGPREDSESASAGARASGGGAPRALRNEAKGGRQQ